MAEPGPVAAAVFDVVVSQVKAIIAPVTSVELAGIFFGNETDFPLLAGVGELENVEEKENRKKELHDV